MNKEDVVFKMKTVSSRPNRYFQPVLTNNTKVISAKLNDNKAGKENALKVNVKLGKLDSKQVSDDLEKKIVVKTKEKKNIENKELNNKEPKNKEVENKESQNIKLKNQENVIKNPINKEIENKSVTNNEDISDKILEDIREQLKIETDKINKDDKSVEKEDETTEENKKIVNDITTKMDLPLNLKKDNESETHHREPAEEIKEFKTKLFLLASNAKKPVRIMVNRKMFLIGSDYSKMDCVIRNNRYISRCHAKIYYENDCYFLEDAGSMNGTYINGVKLAEGLKYKLISGDIINLADCKFEVNIK